jgi:hypothetical protein
MFDRRSIDVVNFSDSARILMGILPSFKVSIVGSLSEQLMNALDEGGDERHEFSTVDTSSDSTQARDFLEKPTVKKLWCKRASKLIHSSEPYVARNENPIKWKSLKTFTNWCHR